MENRRKDKALPLINTDNTDQEKSKSLTTKDTKKHEGRMGTFEIRSGKAIAYRGFAQMIADLERTREKATGKSAGAT